MMKTMRKCCIILLGLVMALSLAVPALPVAAIDYAVLNVRYTPGGTAVGGIEFTAYKVANVTVDGDGKYTYTLADMFRDSKIDLNVLEGKRVNADPTICNSLLSSFGKYINAHPDIKNTEGAAWKEKTGTKSIGTDNKQEKGIAQFTGLPDGLYLVASNNAVWLGNTQYTAIPFLINIPYVDKGVSNNYITVSVKPETYTPPRSTPKPTPTPDDFVDIPEEDPPKAEPPIEILPDDVPKTDFPDLPDDPDIEIPDPDVPLATLPQTGLLWWPVPVMAAAGIVLIIFGAFLKRKA